MKTLFPLLTLSLLALPAAQGQERFQQEAYIMNDAGEGEQVWIADSNKTEFLYFETEQGVDSKKMRISEPKAIWLIEPAAYTEAMELYQGRKYEEALKKFEEVREAYKKLLELPDNHSSLAAFHAMECLRQLGRLDDLAKAQETFLPDDRNSLTRPYHQSQLEFYTMWEAVRSKDWSRLEIVAKDYLAKKIPGYQRAQAGYCLGLALEGQQRAIEAINAYNIAMTADTGASEVITSDAALNALRLYLADADVKLAIKLHGTPDEEPNSIGALRLKEAASLASLFELTLGGGKPLPSEFKDLLKYLPEETKAKEE
ncbi:MAG: hypothetical protein MUF31_07120 [Akkermansiaceae bacterium]|jgi:tetratricopeptide (TPR) repeat protein|nr:hypothetical protein [Akkermansiaceae bacterium]